MKPFADIIWLNASANVYKADVLTYFSSTKEKEKFLRATARLIFEKERFKQKNKKDYVPVS